MEPIKLESDVIDALAAALAKAQAAFGEVTKDKIGKIRGEGKAGQYEYSYRYADLAAVLEAVRQPLAACGLALVQRPIPALGGLVLETRLIHSSGQWIGCVYPLPDPTGRPQEMGSALTYARRYSLTALLGVAPDEDDDAAAAERAHEERRSSGEETPACPKCSSAGKPSKFPSGPRYWCPSPKCKVPGKDGKLSYYGFDVREPGVDEAVEDLFGRADVPIETLPDARPEPRR